MRQCQLRAATALQACSRSLMLHFGKEGLGFCGFIELPAGDTESEPALVLKEERLEDFGGIDEVIRHFKLAPSPEAMRNLLCIILDYVSARHIKVLL